LGALAQLLVRGPAVPGRSLDCPLSERCWNRVGCGPGSGWARAARPTT